MRTILCPFDFSETSTKALLYAYDIALQSKAHLHLLHTYQIPRVVSLMEQTQQPELEMQVIYEREATEKIENLVSWLNKIHAPLSVEATYRVVSNFALDEIVKTCYETDADLIVMETNCTNHLKDIFTGTHTVRVIEESHRPVLVVPADAHYTKISHVLYTTQSTQPQPEEVAFVSELAQLFDASLALLPFQTGQAAANHQSHASAANQFSYSNVLEGSIQILRSTQPLQESIAQFINEHTSTLLAISAQRRYLFEKISTGIRADPLDVPVLVLQ